MAPYSKTLFHEYMDEVISKYWKNMEGTVTFINDITSDEPKD